MLLPPEARPQEGWASGASAMLISFLHKHWFPMAAGVLLTIAAVNVGRHRENIGRWINGVFRQDVLVEAPRWQRWVDANRNFFGPLANGQCVAVVRDPMVHRATVLTKTPQGVRAKTLASFLQPDTCSVSLRVDDATAEKILSTRIDQGDVFWNAWKQLARSGALQIYTVGSQGELEAKGVVSFLRAIDVSPANSR